MRIVVPIKQVPETSGVRMDETTGTVVRDGAEVIVNPLDLYAIESALRLCGDSDEALALSMGPPKAETALREAIAMGCAGGVLVSDRTFAASDTWATSHVLAAAVRKLGQVDLVICGERATDGDTGQVGPGIAAWLDIPFATYISAIVEIRPESLIVERMVESGYETLEIALPCLLTVVKELNYPRLPTLRGNLRAKKMILEVWGPTEIDALTENLGLQGSPTRVVKISTPQVARNGEVVQPKDEHEIEIAVDGLINYLQSKEII